MTEILQPSGSLGSVLQPLAIGVHQPVSPSLGFGFGSPTAVSPRLYVSFWRNQPSHTERFQPTEAAKGKLVISGHR